MTDAILAGRRAKADRVRRVLMSAGAPAESEEPGRGMIRLEAQPVDVGDRGVSLLTFRGRQYTLPAPSYGDTVTFAALAAQLASLSDRVPSPESTLEEQVAFFSTLRDALLAIAERFRRCVRPIGLLDRLRWRWGPNPFADASASEFLAMLAIFGAYRVNIEVSPFEGAGVTVSPFEGL